MDDFYNEICSTTKIINRNLPAQATVEVCVMQALELLIEDWKVMVKISAKSGYKMAYIGIFSKNFKVKGKINLYDYFVMNEEAKELFKEYNIKILEEQLIDIINPFQLELIETEDIFAIVVRWE